MAREPSTAPLVVRAPPAVAPMSDARPVAKRMGRPPGTGKPDHLVKSEVLHWRLTKDEYDELCRRSIRERLPIAEVVRSALFGLIRDTETPRGANPR